jgi:hypothetical protein
MTRLLALWLVTASFGCAGENLLPVVALRARSQSSLRARVEDLGQGAELRLLGTLSFRLERTPRNMASLSLSSSERFGSAASLGGACDSAALCAWEMSASEAALVQLLEGEAP